MTLVKDRLKKELEDLANHGKHRVIYYPKTGSGISECVATVVDFATAIAVASAIVKVDQILSDNFGDRRNTSIEVEEYVSAWKDEDNQESSDGFWYTCPPSYVDRCINESLGIKDVELPLKKVDCGSCEKGVQMCKTYPCFVTFQEAKKLIDLGFQDKLMLDWWENDDLQIDFYLLSCANTGLEKTLATQSREGQCTFLTQDNKCQIHNICKPIEGQSACCKKSNKSARSLHDSVARTWDNPEAQQLIKTLAKEWNLEVSP